MITINTAQVFKPLLEPARDKTFTEAEEAARVTIWQQMVKRCMLSPGTRAVCIREIQPLSLNHRNV